MKAGVCGGVRVTGGFGGDTAQRKHERAGRVEQKVGIRKNQVNRVKMFDPCWVWTIGLTLTYRLEGKHPTNLVVAKSKPKYRIVFTLDKAWIESLIGKLHIKHNSAPTVELWLANVPLKPLFVGLIITTFCQH